MNTRAELNHLRARMVADEKRIEELQKKLLKGKKVPAVGSTWKLRPNPSNWMWNRFSAKKVWTYAGTGTDEKGRTLMFIQTEYDDGVPYFRAISSNRFFEDFKPTRSAP